MLTFKGPVWSQDQFGHSIRRDYSIYIKPSCAKIILQIRPFGQAKPVYAVSHVVIKNIVLQYTETTPLQINLYFIPCLMNK